MQAAWYSRNGAAHDVLEVGERPAPAAGPGEVLVRIHASGVNPSDTKSRARTPLGADWVIPQQDGAGIVEAVGEGVDPGRVGERVWIYEARIGRSNGCAAQFVAVPSLNAVPLPDAVSFDEGACLGVPALTAHRCVFADGPVTGQTVLVTGGAGAVGIHAIQFARWGGARVIATVSREEQAEVARAAGADEAIFRTREDVAARIAEITGAGDGRGVDRIVDVAFGTNLDTTLKVIRPGGVVATYASDEVPEPALPFWPLLALDVTVRFVLVYRMTRQAHEDAIRDTLTGLREGWLKTVVAARYPLGEIAAAHEALESGRTVGKVVVQVP